MNKFPRFQQVKAQVLVASLVRMTDVVLTICSWSSLDLAVPALDPVERLFGWLAEGDAKADLGLVRAELYPVAVHSSRMRCFG